jgi:polyhydroxybutyrate depolymerase
MERDFGLAEFARVRGFAYSAPDGSLDRQGRRFWNAGKICCNFGHHDVDDVARLSAIIKDAVVRFRVDERRVFVVGYSNGGFMAHRLACERAEEIRAIVSMAAAGPAADEPCSPANPVAVLEVHGDRDTVVPYPGGHLFSRSELPITPSVEQALKPWATVNQCEGRLRSRHRRDLVTTAPGDETLVFSYDDCAGAPISLWKITGGQHWLGLDVRALDAIWRFLIASTKHD